MASYAPYKQPPEYNVRGDSANGTTGTQTAGAIGNQILSSKPASGGNAFADMVAYGKPKPMAQPQKRVIPPPYDWGAGAARPQQAPMNPGGGGYRPQGEIPGVTLAGSPSAGGFSNGSRGAIPGIGGSIPMGRDWRTPQAPGSIPMGEDWRTPRAPGGAPQQENSPPMVTYYDPATGGTTTRNPNGGGASPGGTVPFWPSRQPPPPTSDPGLDRAPETSGGSYMRDFDGGWSGGRGGGGEPPDGTQVGPPPFQAPPPAGAPPPQSGNGGLGRDVVYERPRELPPQGGYGAVPGLGGPALPPSFTDPGRGYQLSPYEMEGTSPIWQSTGIQPTQGQPVPNWNGNNPGLSAAGVGGYGVIPGLTVPPEFGGSNMTAAPEYDTGLRGVRKPVGDKQVRKPGGNLSFQQGGDGLEPVANENLVSSRSGQYGGGLVTVPGAGSSPSQTTIDGYIPSTPRELPPQGEPDFGSPGAREVLDMIPREMPVSGPTPDGSIPTPGTHQRYGTSLKNRYASTTAPPTDSTSIPPTAGGGTSTTTGTTATSSIPAYDPTKLPDVNLEWMDPIRDQAMKQVERQALHAGSLTGATNSGGFIPGLTQELSGVAEQFAAMKGDKTFTAQQAQADRVLSDFQFRSAQELTKWAKEHEFELQQKGLDVQTLLGRWQMQSAKYGADAAGAAAGASAAASMYGADRSYQASMANNALGFYNGQNQFNLGMYGTDVDRERNIMNYLSQLYGMSPEMLKLFGGSDPSQLFPGYNPGNTVTIK